MEKLYVAIDIGCHECGVSSELVGAFMTNTEAEEACKNLPTWRDGGSTQAEIFEIEIPN